jgi:hypothetical protein
MANIPEAIPGFDGRMIRNVHRRVRRHIIGLGDTMVSWIFFFDIQYS